MIFVRELTDLLGNHQSVDQDYRIPVLHDLHLSVFRERTGGHVDTYPPSLEAGHHPGDLISRDRGIRLDTFGLPQDNKLGDGHSCTHIEPSDKVGSSIL